MTKIRGKTFFFILAIVMVEVMGRPAVASVRPIVLTGSEDNENTYILTPFMEELEDKTNALDIERIKEQRHPGAIWHEIREEVPNYGFSNSSYWYRFKIDNQGTGSQKWFLEIDFPPLDEVTLYSPAKGSSYTEKKLGDTIPFNVREIESNVYIFDLHEIPKDQPYYYLNIKTTGSMQLPIYVKNSKAVIEDISFDKLGYGLFYGLIISMIIYNFFLYFSLKDIHYLLYVCYILAYGLYQASFSSVGYQYLWPESPSWSTISIPFTGSMSMLGLMVFSYLFLKIADERPWVKIVFHIFFLWAVFGIISSVAFSYNSSTKNAVILTATGAFFLMYASWSRLQKKYRPARFYFIASFSFMVAIVIFALKTGGTLPANFFTHNCLPIGFSIQVMLLSISLGDRLSYINQCDKKDIELLNQKLQRHINEVEQIVAERTKQITTVINNVKTGFLLIDSQGRIMKGYTKSCYGIFHNLDEGMLFSDLLRLEGQKLKVYECAISQIFEDTLPEDVTVAMLPGKFRLDDRVFDLEGSVVRSENTNKIESILFTIVDSTALASSEMLAQKNATLLKIISNIKSFSDFLRLTKESLSTCKNEIRNNRSSLKDVKIALHTISGNSSVYDLSDIVAVIAAIETKNAITAADMEKIENSFSRFLEDNQNILH
ncbi:MAG: hypothetical protein HQK54_16200, partial [Oligoflexales bacterium]|nr:hypothetical protein [Oligoflexales bacterium]